MKEKEIIDKLKELQNDSFEWTGGEDLIDFIKKLKKENEELKKITTSYDAFPKYNKKNSIIIASPDFFQNGTFVKKFISKDKIRELFKELYIIEESKYAKIKTTDNDKLYKFAKDIQKLLEEE